MSAPGARRRRAIASAFVATFASLAGMKSADAHLMPAHQGTINVVDGGAFAVVSIPVSSLHGFDDDGDGVMSLPELTRHDAELRAEIDRRFAIFDDQTPAQTERVDLVLSPQHDATPDRASEVVALKHATFAAPPTDLRVTCDLFGLAPDERQLTITATRNKQPIADAQPAIFTPTAADHRLFPSVAAATIATPRAPLGDRALLAVLVATVAIALAAKLRKQPESARPHRRSFDGA